MTNGLDISAAGDVGGYLEIIILVAFVLLSVLGGTIKKAMKRQEERRAEEARLRQLPQAPQPEQEVVSQDDLDTLVAAARRTFGLQAEAPPRSVMAGPEAPGEVLRDHARQRMQKKPAAAPAVAPPSEPAVPMAGRPKPAARPRPSPAAGLLPGLANVENARRAIIYREILSMPKALREEPEMWEL
jgi:hypothetical protein